MGEEAVIGKVQFLARWAYQAQFLNPNHADALSDLTLLISGSLV